MNEYLIVGMILIGCIVVLYPWIYARIQLYLLRKVKDPLGSGPSVKDPEVHLTL